MEIVCVRQAWQAHEGELFHFLLRHLGSREEAEDMLQDVFLRMLQQGESFCQVKQPRAWLFRVARNGLIDRQRRQKTVIELPAELPAEENRKDPIAELEACLQRNLVTLSALEQEIIKQCDLAGVRQQTFARRHGLSLPAAKARLRRARKKLRSAIVRNCQVRFDESGKVCCHVPRPTGQ